MILSTWNQMACRLTEYGLTPGRIAILREGFVTGVNLCLRAEDCGVPRSLIERELEQVQEQHEQPRDNYASNKLER